MEKDQQHNDEIRKLLDEATSPEERERLSAILGESEKLKVPEGKSTATAWQEFASKVEKPEEGHHAEPGVLEPSRNWRRLMLPVAASVSLIITLYFVLTVNKTTTVRAEVGERLTHVLPDGSEVILNAATSIAYKSSSWGTNRNIQLDGEAFFSVKKGQEFTVQSSSGKVVVLGTSFNIYDREGSYEVQCKTGKVRVEVMDQRIELEKGQATLWDNNQLKPPFATTEEKSGAWTQGKFYFEEKSLTKVFEELQRQFAVEIKAQGVEGRIYTGFFTTNSLEEALDLVCTPMGLKYQIGDGVIEIE